jgi:hypothetical protein
MASTYSMQPEFTDEEIDKMRGKLARLWRQSKSQVMDVEALWYLRADKAARDAEATAPSDLA